MGGSKCSAASRAYIPKSIWPAVREALVEQVRGIDMGDPTDWQTPRRHEVGFRVEF